ncbi:heavy metal translocating P-type ATPase [Pectinatus haikarae]|uniref:heavy metal translocating P-type ATPase n=1 Tax=Pectinatus haikarae TaxID=349096 RepID=UPI002ED967B7
MKEKFAVTGMTCSACSSHVEKSVAKVSGVSSVSVNLLTNSMQVDFDNKITKTAEIVNAVENAGYGASVYGKAEKKQLPSQNTGIAAMKKRLIVSIVFLLPLLYIAMGHMLYEALSWEMPVFMDNYFTGDANAVAFAFTQLILLLPIMFVNRNYFENGFKTLFKGSPNMDSLIAIGAGAAAVYGIFAIYRIGYGLGHADMAVVEQYRLNLYFESAGMILTLITVGKFLEARSKGKTSEAITKLMQLTPKTVTVIRNDREEVIDAEQVAAGDIYIVKPGEAAAVDGIVLEGKSFFDESAITGESMPAAKEKGDKLISASINKTGLIKAKAVRVGEDTTIAQIIKLVEEASSSKAPIAKLADKIAGVFVPVVIGLAIVTAVLWLSMGAGAEFAVSTAIAVLVISCPCALGLATPVAIMTGTGRGAQQGVLIKSGEALQTAHQIDTMVLDKTGTITQGKPKVTDIICAEGIAEKELLIIAGSIEKGSEHPLAEAVVNKCIQEDIALLPVSESAAYFGRGTEGILNGHKYYAGNEKLMKEKQIDFKGRFYDLVQTLAGQGKTPLIFADEKNVLGIIAVADTIKATSRKAVEKLKSYGINVIMLTGDSEAAAKAISKQAGIEHVIAGVLPDQKEAQVSALKQEGHVVAMVGDGVNDAPALAAADVGIAIGAGTDVAIDSADIVLMKSDLLDAAKAIRLSKAVIRNIKENLFWAFFYNVIGIPLAAGALYLTWGIRLNPMFAAAAMSLSSVCVVSNALRLKRLRLGDSVNEDESVPNSNIDVYKGKEENNMKTTTIMIEGMSCGHCTGRVEKALQQVDGVDSVKVSLENKNAVVSAGENVTADVLKNAVTNAGYDVIGVK